jgi:hypothetical protein
VCAIAPFDHTSLAYDEKFHGIFNNLITEQFGAHAAPGALDRDVLGGYTGDAGASLLAYSRQAFFNCICGIINCAIAKV